MSAMSTMRRLLCFLWPYRWAVVLAVLLGVLTVTSSTLLLAASAYVIAAAALRPLLVQLTLPIYLVRFVGFSRAISRYAERIVSHNTTFRLLATARIWFYHALEPLAPARLLAYRSGDLLTRITDDIEELQNLYQQALAPVLIALLTAAATFAALLRFDRALAWVTLGFLIVAGAGVPLLAWWLARGYGQRERALTAERNACLVDGIQGVQDLLAFGREGDRRTQVAALDHALGAVQRRMAIIAGIQGALGELTASLAMVAALALAIPLVGRGAIGGVYLGVVALVALGAFDALTPLATAFQFLGRSLAAGGRLFAVVDTAPAVTDPPAPLPTPQMPLLEFDHVSFRYAADGPETLHEVNFTLPPGSHVAIVGPSGSGKSTLVRLAARFWDPDAGTIRLGGHDVRAYAQDDLCRALGIVAQDTYLFNTTVRANLRLARPDATDDDCHAALAGAQLDTWLAQLPQGLDSWIGEEGLRLSGGERQRLAIARALLQEAPILILDEPTANLDPRTERVLLAHLHALMAGRTTLMITHRLVAMDAWDEILVLDRGRIVERGTHATLKAAEGRYARLLAVQDDVIVDASTYGR